MVTGPAPVRSRVSWFLPSYGDASADEDMRQSRGRSRGRRRKRIAAETTRQPAPWTVAEMMRKDVLSVDRTRGELPFGLRQRRLPLDRRGAADTACVPFLETAPH